MKTLTLSALALTVFAGVASASTASDFDRFNVDADQLTASQELAISNVIHGSGTDSEKRAVINSLVNQG